MSVRVVSRGFYGVSAVADGVTNQRERREQGREGGGRSRGQRWAE